MCDSNKHKCRHDTKPLKRDSLDTLAQLGTRPVDGDDFQLNRSTNSKDKITLVKRAKRKYLSNSLMFNLVDIAKEHRDSTTSFDDFNKQQKILRSYWSMYHCANKLDYNNGKLTGRYCKHRFCLVCNSIRQAVLLKKYSPVIYDWGQDVYFVTLTIPNICAEFLESSINEMQSIVTKIQRRIKKRLQRAKLEPMQGIRKLECTYNSNRRNYHPHYHLIIKGKKNAEDFLKSWLDDTKHLGTTRKAQDIRKADRKAPKELFKYFTKIISSSDKDKKVYVRSLDVIFKAMQGKRTFQSFGFKLPKDIQEDKDSFELNVEFDADYKGDEKEQYIWFQDSADWVSNITGVFLSEHKLSKSIQEIPKRMIKGYG